MEGLLIVCLVVEECMMCLIRDFERLSFSLYFSAEDIVIEEFARQKLKGEKDDEEEKEEEDKGES